MEKSTSFLSECIKGGNRIMEGSLTELSKHRLETAFSDFETAKALYEMKQFRVSINRSYYSIFHALRAVVILDGFDSSKHSGIIAYFNIKFLLTLILY